MTGRTVVERFEEQAGRRPDAPAVVCGDERLTYAELNERANRVAGGLRAQGVGLESLVGLCLERSVELAVAMLAIAKSGAAYVALDPQHPEDRLRYLVEDSGAVCVVGEAGSDAGRTVPTLTTGQLARPSDGNPPLAAGPGNALYVVYTSGSTGQPKAVVMAHGPTARLMRWAGRRYRLDGTVLQYFPITSDVCSYEFFSTWWAGGCAVIAQEADRMDVPALAGLVRRHRIGTVLLPGAVLEELARHGREHPEDVAGIREIVTTGDRLTIGAHLRAMCAGPDGPTLDNQWGSTEVNVVTALRLTAPADSWPASPRIGSPVSGGRIHVLDEHLRQVPVNVPGDLYVGGGQLARGYLGRPDVTAASFLPDPFAAEPGARMYRTGDRGRWRPDGTLEFLGRADFQLKVHGYRVEPGEIETVLREHPGVARAAVTAHPAASGLRLAAHVSAVPGGRAPEPAELLEFLRGRLPDHMVPQACVVLDRLPLTATGKVDRKALPEPGFDAVRYVPPRDGIDRRIVEVWQEVLGRAVIGIQDNFFELGGHSLLIPQVVHRVNQAFGARLPLRSLFRAQTVRAMADEVRAGTAAPPGPGA
ncbi:amino acid adenylation domain-containing protein [Kitasatospora sp. NPDC056138]|uniref:non-ribosomal peptide synthetase n=1 Tax=Kitasatospora sp. NPDC056138 TaxID=3345724 RepID=UPI0035E146F4